ncbi:MAG: flagellar hook-length control protein FliK, partial [Epibacterium sp.]|nr:flagellar hook-length control protein FliK [Epibacterium sp.]NQX75551.1 flagellar hook-length control protein FliK [Epibacterium sp.]
DRRAEPDESDSTDLAPDFQDGDADSASPVPADSVNQLSVAGAGSKDPTVSSENAATDAVTGEASPASTIATPPSVAERGLSAGQSQESDTEEGTGLAAEDVEATDPLVGLSASQSAPVQQGSLAARTQVPQGGARRAAHSAELVQPTAGAGTTGDETAQAKLARDHTFRTGTQSLRSELAASQILAVTTSAAPPIPVHGPGSQSTRPAMPSVSGLMTSGGALVAPNALGATLTTAVSDETALDLPLQFAGAARSAERDSDMIALPQMLTEASVRAGSNTVHRDGTPRLVAVQLAEAAMQGKPKVDVILNPQELGNVTMRLSTTENGIAMLIRAERPETEELMRRHIHELEKEFKEMGFENIEFSFAGGGTEDASNGGGGSAEVRDGFLDEAALMETEEETALMGGHLNLAAEVLDMRV